MLSPARTFYTIILVEKFWIFLKYYCFRFLRVGIKCINASMYNIWAKCKIFLTILLGYELKPVPLILALFSYHASPLLILHICVFILLPPFLYVLILPHFFTWQEKARSYQVPNGFLPLTPTSPISSLARESS